VACWQVLALHSERKKALADRLEKHREASGVCRSDMPVQWMMAPCSQWAAGDKLCHLSPLQAERRWLGDERSTMRMSRSLTTNSMFTESAAV